MGRSTNRASSRDRPNDMQAKLVIVSGARPQVSALLKQAGIKEEFKGDLRITSKETLKASKMAKNPSI